MPLAASKPSRTKCSSTTKWLNTKEQKCCCLLSVTMMKYFDFSMAAKANLILHEDSSIALICLTFPGLFTSTPSVPMPQSN